MPEILPTAPTLIVPTVGNPANLLPMVQRLLEATQVPQYRLVVVCNPVEATQPHVRTTRAQVEAAVAVFNETRGEDYVVDLHWLQLPGPVGWTGGVNLGVRHLLEHGLHSPAVAVLNDDILVTSGWLGRMLEALEPQAIMLQGELAMYGGEDTPWRDPSAFGRIGMVGPCSNEVAGVQKVQPPEVRLGNGAAFITQGSDMLERFSADFHKQNAGRVMQAAFLSGFCVLYRWECLQDLLEEHDGQQCLLRPCYGTGGYDDNDVAVRADRLGWRRVVARDVYVHHLGHQTLDAHFPEAQRGLANMATYLRAWEADTTREQRLVAVYRVGFEVPWDLHLLRRSLEKVISMVDGVALLVTSSPAAVVSGPEWRPGQLQPLEAQLVAECGEAGADASAVGMAVQEYLQRLVEHLQPEHDMRVLAAMWEGEWNERDERNAAIQLGLSLEPDWLISVDHDEVPEDGVDRATVQRLMRHPDPAVCSYDVGWLNFWDNNRLTRVDTPWCVGYRSSMRGFRMWRVGHPDHQRILAGNDKGLHCGNVPDHGANAVRVAGFRFKHYGYTRPQDRLRKYRRYRMLDPEPDAAMTQGTTKRSGSYDHLINEEGMQVSPYQPKNRIGLTMLYHAGEHLSDLFRHLDLSYGLVDEVVLVWTGPEGTGPDEETQYVARRFGARWIHKPLNDHLGEARNAGVDELDRLGCHWCWVMDPDEHLAPHFDSLVALRRMAECTNSWAWMFRFRNHRPDGKWNWSENTRLFRLEGGVLRFGQRVHETLEASIAELGRRGIHPQVRYAPFVVEHFGLASMDDEATQRKLQRYTRLLVRQIIDDPLGSPGAWVSLGLQYGNDGRSSEQWACYEVAVRTSENGYLPWREAALHKLREGTALLQQALARLTEGHELYEPTKQFLQQLMQQAPPQPRLGAARQGMAIPPDVELPSLLQLVQVAEARKRLPALDAASPASENTARE